MSDKDCVDFNFNSFNGDGGSFVVAPQGTINVQIAFYRWINWRIEPLSWEKEIRNTRIMGVIAFVAGVAALYALRK